MKTFLTVAISVWFSLAPLHYSAAQAVSINTDNSLPDASAILDVKSTDRGMLVPRLTTAQRLTIASPATGLMVYDSDTQSFWYKDETGWVNLLTRKTGWSTSGNAASGNDFIGTTNSQSLLFKADNLQAGKIDLGLSNTFFGLLAGSSTTSGSYNTAFGTNALLSNTNANGNTAVGAHALYFNTAGSNTALGQQAMYYNTTGHLNTAIGGDALYANTTGGNNIAVGFQALYSNTVAFNNTATGYQALKSNTTGYDNTANGSDAMQDNTTGYGNTVSGSYALLNNTTGIFNTTSGNYCMYFNTDGSNNSAYGQAALGNNITGDNNTATGFRALNASIANYNTANGALALEHNTSGFSNVAVGYQAMLNNTTGFNNVAGGRDALLENTTGDQRSAFGHSSNSLGADYANSTGLGYNTDCTAANQVRIGNSSVTSIGGYEPWSNISDGRFKRDVEEHVAGLAFILKLRPVTYRFDQIALENFIYTHYGERDTTPWPEKYNASVTLRSGFIAQEVLAAAQSVDYDFSGIDPPKNEDDFFSLRYAIFTVPLVKAVQEQQGMIDLQDKEIKNLTEQNAVLQTSLDEKLADQQHQIDALYALLKGQE